MARKILITGGTGLVGTLLSQKLIDKGHQVVLLSRTKDTSKLAQTFLWDINKGYIDENCINGVDTIVHLAGAPIAEKRWTKERKKLIIESRTKSIELIYNLLQKKQHQVKAVISASGSGYYSNRGDEIMHETDFPNNDFLAKCCIEWEKAVDKGVELGLRVVKLRSGIILHKNKGALPLLLLPVKFGFGANLGNGNQWMSWIHCMDAVNAYSFAIENENMNGSYNMSTPYPVTFESFNRTLAEIFKKPLWLPNIPAFILKMALGKMSITVLGSTKMCADKLLKEGFKFEYSNLEIALKEIYGK